MATQGLFCQAWILSGAQAVRNATPQGRAVLGEKSLLALPHLAANFMQAYLGLHKHKTEDGVTPQRALGAGRERQCKGDSSH